MSKRGDTTGREELRKEMIINLKGLLDEPGLTSSESKMIKGKIKKLKAGGNPLSAEFTNLNRGGDMTKKSKKVPVISISVGMAEMKKGKGPMKMAMGGMANGKKHKGYLLALKSTVTCTQTKTLKVQSRV